MNVTSCPQITLTSQSSEARCLTLALPAPQMCVHIINLWDMIQLLVASTLKKTESFPTSFSDLKMRNVEGCCSFVRSQAWKQNLRWRTAGPDCWARRDLSAMLVTAFVHSVLEYPCAPADHLWTTRTVKLSI